MAGKIVVDASAALKWFFQDEPDVDAATLMLLDYAAEKVSFTAPMLFYYEMSNAVHIAVKRARITGDEGRAIIKDLLAIKMEIADSPELLSNAYLNAGKYDMSVYDALYFTLAKDNGYRFYTGDMKLFNRVKDKKRFVHLISDYKTR